MRVFLPYVQELERLLEGRDARSQNEWRSRCILCLNGEPARELRRVTSLADLQSRGAFFTGSTLAKKAILALGVPPRGGHRFLDPTCGAGDLLLAVARKLPRAGSVQGTLALWGERLAGCETSREFVRATRARLALLAMLRCKSRVQMEATELRRLFPMIRQGDAFAATDLYAHADRLIMNPPFCARDAPERCEWAEGKVNAAALLTETAVRNAKRDARILAILPDVLRSGTRYARWRGMVGALADVERVQPHGLFDERADVDVFLLGLTIGERHGGGSPEDWTFGRLKEGATVSTRFEVRVGPVVPHRHKDAGTSYRYIRAPKLPPWGTKHRISEQRRFSGTVFAPPFVAVRRTSSPSDSKRAVATVVLGLGEVAVENHLLVCVPRDGTVGACHELLRRLRLARTDAWLNRRIRCRHLTVSALADMPWWDAP